MAGGWEKEETSSYLISETLRVAICLRVSFPINDRWTHSNMGKIPLDIVCARLWVCNSNAYTSIYSINQLVPLLSHQLMPSIPEHNQRKLNKCNIMFRGIVYSTYFIRETRMTGRPAGRRFWHVSQCPINLCVLHMELSTRMKMCNTNTRTHRHTNGTPCHGWCGQWAVLLKHQRPTVVTGNQWNQWTSGITTFEEYFGKTTSPANDQQCFVLSAVWTYEILINDSSFKCMCWVRSWVM